MSQSGALHANGLFKFFFRKLQQSCSLQVNLLPLEHIDELQLLFEGHHQLTLLALQPFVLCTARNFLQNGLRQQ